MERALVYREVGTEAPTMNDTVGQTNTATDEHGSYRLARGRRKGQINRGLKQEGLL